MRDRPYNPSMSGLFLATDPDLLAERLAEEIRRRQTPQTYFVPQTIVVPNRFVRQWLKYRLAEKLDVAINLRFRFLEEALWDWLREIDPRPHVAQPEMLDDGSYQILALSVLLTEEDAALKPLQDFCERDGLAELSRLGSRRAWHLAQRLGSLIRDYEYHRQEQIIQPWLRGDFGLGHAPRWHEREAAQQAVFRHITREGDGRRALLNAKLGRNFKTLPQYVMELLLEVPRYREPSAKTIHLFGLQSISRLHLRALELLLPMVDCNVFHMNPLASRLPTRVDHAAIQRTAAAFRGADRPDAKPGTELLHIWGRAGAETLSLTADFLNKPAFKAHLLTAKKTRRKPTVLNRLQDAISSPLAPREVCANPPAPHAQATTSESASGRSVAAGARTPLAEREGYLQDTSLQIVACPGIQREVETVHNSILHNLQTDPTMRQTDIGVLVTDMETYRPHLMAQFEKPPRPISYNLADYTAARLSVFGQALVGMLDLGLESFARSRVFEVLLNPCFLAKLEVDSAAALKWLDWAERLGIFHSWNAEEKRELGFFPSPLYSWKLGMQRLRLGRYMDTTDDDEPARHWRRIVPFADVESVDHRQLDPFCQAVEGLLPLLYRLRHFQGSAADWIELLRTLVTRFLDVPEDRPEETPVRDALLESIDRLRCYDAARADGKATLRLALVREYLATQLQEIPGRRSEFLTGGVTIAALQPQRPVPFRVVYIVGLGEKHFPGNSFVSPLDLRDAKRQPGDILPVEHQRLAFLEALLTVRDKLYLTYNQRDLQTDQEFQPAVPLLQLKRFLEKQIVAGGAFGVVNAPLLSHGEQFLAGGPAWQDVIVQYRAPERLLAIEDARAAKRLVFSEFYGDLEVEDRHAQMTRSFAAPTVSTETKPSVTLPLQHLREFLVNPANAASRFQLRIEREWGDEPEDHEPLVSSNFVSSRLIQRILETLTVRSETEPLEELARDWSAEFDRRYEEEMLRCQLPEHAFGQVDREELRLDLRNRVEGPNGLLAFLGKQKGKPMVGPILIGESTTPIGARLRFPALVLPLKRRRTNQTVVEARVVGSQAIAWDDGAALELLILKTSGDNSKERLVQSVFEPLLFLLALAAVDEGMSRRAFVLHSARAEGIRSVRIPAGKITASVGRIYLTRRAEEYVDPSCADLLPFQLLREKGELSSVLNGLEIDPNDFFMRLRTAIDSIRFTSNIYVDQKEAGFAPPRDAFEKARRRFLSLNLLLTGQSCESALE